MKQHPYIRRFFIVIIVIGITLTVLTMLALSPIGWFVYKTQFKETTISTYTSPDGVYQLTFLERGEPTFPYGAAHGRFVLQKGRDRVSRYDWNANYDGVTLSNSLEYSPPDVQWRSDRVTVCIVDTEKGDWTYDLYYDGKVEATNSVAGNA